MNTQRIQTYIVLGAYFALGLLLGYALAGKKTQKESVKAQEKVEARLR